MSRDKNPLLLYALLCQVTSDVLTIDNNGVGMTVDPTRNKKSQSVGRGL